MTNIYIDLSNISVQSCVQAEYWSNTDGITINRFSSLSVSKLCQIKVGQSIHSILNNNERLNSNICRCVVRVSLSNIRCRDVSYECLYQTFVWHGHVLIGSTCTFYLRIFYWIRHVHHKPKINLGFDLGPIVIQPLMYKLSANQVACSWKSN